MFWVTFCTQSLAAGIVYPLYSGQILGSQLHWKASKSVNRPDIRRPRKRATARNFKRLQYHNLQKVKFYNNIRERWGRSPLCYLWDLFSNLSRKPNQQWVMSLSSSLKRYSLEMEEMLESAEWHTGTYALQCSNDQPQTSNFRSHNQHTPIPTLWVSPPSSMLHALIRTNTLKKSRGWTQELEKSLFVWVTDCFNLGVANRGCLLKIQRPVFQSMYREDLLAKIIDITFIEGFLRAFENGKGLWGHFIDLERVMDASKLLRSTNADGVWLDVQVCNRGHLYAKEFDLSCWMTPDKAVAPGVMPSLVKWNKGISFGQVPTWKVPRISI